MTFSRTIRANEGWFDSDGRLKTCFGLSLVRLLPKSNPFDGIRAKLAASICGTSGKLLLHNAESIHVTIVALKYHLTTPPSEELIDELKHTVVRALGSTRPFACRLHGVVLTDNGMIVVPAELSEEVARVRRLLADNPEYYTFDHATIGALRTGISERETEDLAAILGTYAARTWLDECVRSLTLVYHSDHCYRTKRIVSEILLQ